MEQSAQGEAPGRAMQGSQALDYFRDGTDILQGSEQGPDMLQIGPEMNKPAPSVVLCTVREG